MTSAPVEKSSEQLQLDANGQPTNRLRSKVRTVDLEREVVYLLVREKLADDQRTDAELSRVVQLRLITDERPTNESVQSYSELRRLSMLVKWDNLEIHNGLVY